MPTKTKSQKPKAKTPKRKLYISPTLLVIKAAQEAEKIRHEPYSLLTLHKLAEHNHTKLVPAMAALMQWALDLQREVNHIEAKLIAEARKEAKQKGGKGAK